MSVSAPWTLKNECANPQCQHEKDSHHLGVDNCLVIHCECKRFKKEGEKEPAASFEWRIDPDQLKPVDDDDSPDTPRMPGWGPWP